MGVCELPETPQNGDEKMEEIVMWMKKIASHKSF